MASVPVGATRRPCLPSERARDQRIVTLVTRSEKQRLQRLAAELEVDWVGPS